eukprot:TRINITY_DN74356_c0_g1_i1.p1 TRINITY_DN74356_c0_g1~~TRINITY_DN74356_c0_g1_i1.p1  ORF type:complete len:701 (-),score=129.72 TRINITY_DN74356_c0_g1_i1:13-2115(-)
MAASCTPRYDSGPNIEYRCSDRHIGRVGAYPDCNFDGSGTTGAFRQPNVRSCGGNFGGGGEHVGPRATSVAVGEVSAVKASVACLRGSQTASDGMTHIAAPSVPWTLGRSGAPSPAPAVVADSLRITAAPASPRRNAYSPRTQRLSWFDEALPEETPRPLDPLTRATLAEARAERAEAELSRIRKTLGEAQQRYLDSNQLLKRLSDANATLRTELETLRSRSSGPIASASIGDGWNVASGVPNASATATSPRFQVTTSPRRLGSPRRSGGGLPLPLLRSNVGDARSVPSFDDESGCCGQPRVSGSCSRLQSPGGLSACTSGAALLASCDESFSAPCTQRSEVPALRHRVWALEREQQEAKRLLAVRQVDVGKWRERCLSAEDELAKVEEARAGHEVSADLRDELSAARDASERARRSEAIAIASSVAADESRAQAETSRRAEATELSWELAACASARRSEAICEEKLARTRTAEATATMKEAAAARALTSATEESAAAVAARKAASADRQRLAAAIAEEAELEAALRDSRKEERREAESAVAWSRAGPVSEVLAEVADLQVQNRCLREECKELHAQVSQQIEAASFVGESLQVAQQRSVAAEKAIGLLRKELEVERRRSRGGVSDRQPLSDVTSSWHVAEGSTSGRVSSPPKTVCFSEDDASDEASCDRRDEDSLSHSSNCSRYSRDQLSCRTLQISSED